MSKAIFQSWSPYVLLEGQQRLDVLNMYEIRPLGTCNEPPGLQTQYKTYVNDLRDINMFDSEKKSNKSRMNNINVFKSTTG